MSRSRQAWNEVFGFDLRSLALFRILLGTLVVIDLLNRSHDLVAHYCDEGVLPREALLQTSHRTWHVSLHMLSGEPLVQGLLFVFAGVMAVLMIVGYRTWLTTFLSWVMMVSLHARNPVVLNGGDVEFRLLLFWSLFLPLGARWSIDRLLDKSTPVGDQQHVSLGTFGYLSQIALLYLFAGILKTGSTWSNGTAVHYVMELDFYGKSCRHLLLPHPWLMTFLTHFTFYLELCGWLLLLIPWKQTWFRLVTVALFVGMHFSFFLTLTLGMFAWIGMVAWVPFLPGKIWDCWIPDRVSRWCHTIANGKIAPLVDGLERKSWLQARPVCVRLGRFGSAVALFSVILILAWNIQGTVTWRVAEPFRSITLYSRVSQKWNMFAPNPFTNDGWSVVSTQLSNGREVDLLTGKNVTFDKPESSAGLFPNHRWRKYFRNLLSQDAKEHRRWYARYARRKWNREHSHSNEQLETLRLIYMLERTDLNDSSPPIVTKVLWQ
jgi:hypothetical protein